MWLKFNVVDQQPLIKFSSPIVLLLQINATSVAYRSATADSEHSSADRTATVSASQADTNNDQIPDLFSFRFEMVKATNEHVYGVQMFAPHVCYLEVRSPVHFPRKDECF